MDWSPPRKRRERKSLGFESSALLKRNMKLISKENMPQPGDIVGINPIYITDTKCKHAIVLKILHDSIDGGHKFSEFQLLIEDRIESAFGYEIYVL